MTKQAHRALNVVCPKCRAPKGQPCRTLNRRSGPGRRKAVAIPHPARRKLARERFVVEKNLRAQILPLLGGDKAEARKLASEMVDFEKKHSLAPLPSSTKEPNPPHPGEVSRPGAKRGRPVGYHRTDGARQSEGVTEATHYRIRRFLILRERYKRQQKRQLARALESKPSHNMDFAATPELVKQLGIKASRLSQRSRSSTIGKLFVDEDIDGAQMELASEIAEAHKLVAGEMYIGSRDLGAPMGSGSGKRWISGDMSIRDLVLEETYRQWRAVHKDEVLRALQDILIFDKDLGLVCAQSECSKGAFVTMLIASLDKWEKYRELNTSPEGMSNILVSFEETEDRLKC